MTQVHERTQKILLEFRRKINISARKDDMRDRLLKPNTYVTGILERKQR